MFGIDDMALAMGGSALISGGANIFGGMTSAAGAANANAQNMQIANLNAQLQRETNWQNRELYNDNRDWQERMSNSAYQRQMQDMRLAGLNPILAYAKGGGASSPATNAPTLAAPQLNTTMQNTEAEKGRAIGMAANSAMTAARSVADIQNMSEQNKLLKENQAKTAADTRFADANTLKAIADTDLTKGQIQNLPQILKLLIGQTDAAHSAAGASSATARAVSQDAARKEETGDSWLGHQVNTIKRLWGSAAPVIRDRINSPGPSSGPGLLRDDPNHWLYKKR